MQAFLVPLAATWLSDLFINNVVYAQYYPEFTWLAPGFYWQYGSYVLITLAGIFLLRKVTPVRVLTAALCSTAIFFLVSNFGCWIGSMNYAQNLPGLASCYAAGLPFLKGTLLGEPFYSAVLFGGVAWMQRRVPALRVASVRTT